MTKLGEFVNKFVKEIDESEIDICFNGYTLEGDILFAKVFNVIIEKKNYTSDYISYYRKHKEIMITCKHFIDEIKRFEADKPFFIHITRKRYIYINRILPIHISII
jgi:hypothetical protein